MYNIAASGGAGGANLNTGINFSNQGVSPSGDGGGLSVAAARSDVDYLSGISRLLDKYLPSVLSEMASMSNSALQAEIQSAQVANDLTYKMFKESQDFNANQALLAFNRSQMSAREQMAFETREREAAQNWTAEREDSYYERLIGQLKKVGLNPALGLSGASLPTSSSSGMSGASASSGSAAISSPSARKAEVSAASGVSQRLLSNILSSAISAAQSELNSSTSKSNTSLSSTLSSVSTVVAVIGGAIARAALAASL